MKKKKFIIISIIAIILLIAIAITVTILIVKKNDEQGKEQETMENRISTLLDNNYKYYYYMYGDVKVSDGSIAIGDETYYYVDEEIMTLDEFETLVSDTFVSDMQLTLIDVEEKNEYINIDDKIYVKKIANPCKNIREYDFSDLHFDGDDEKKYIYYEQTRTPIYNEDGIWKLGNNIYVCESEE